jgi:cellulase
MWSILGRLTLIALPQASAHGRLTEITTSGGIVYTGWDPKFGLQPIPPPQMAAWSASNLGNTFVPPSSFHTSDITCHFNATPGALHVNITAGDTLKLQWNEWPISHIGPVISYLAACNKSCSKVDKNELQWVKIDELGWLNSTGWDDLDLGGTWASNVLIANEFHWIVKIPEVLMAGYYTLRHEIIALHVAEDLNGAQAYPQCVNLRVEGAGLKSLDDGVQGSNLYGMRDTGILIDVHQNIHGYSIPGPPIWSHATPMEQPNQ